VGFIAELVKVGLANRIQWFWGYVPRCLNPDAECLTPMSVTVVISSFGGSN